jgi:hypothetical protein
LGINAIYATKPIQTTIPVTTSERIETIGNPTMADIPLVTENDNTLLLAQLPVGFGLMATGGRVS